MKRLFAAATFALAFATLPAIAAHHDHDDHKHEEHDHDHKHEEHDHDHHGHDHDTHKAEMNGIVAVHAWAQATHGNDALVFVEIENESVADVLLEGGECACAQKVELVGYKDGTYVAQASAVVKAGSDLVLAPKGVALKLIGLKTDLHKGDEVEMELEFSTGHMDVHVQIEAETATQHSHAGHAH